MRNNAELPQEFQNTNIKSEKPIHDIHSTDAAGQPIKPEVMEAVHFYNEERERLRAQLRAEKRLVSPRYI